MLLIKGKIPVQNLIWPALIWLCKNKRPQKASKNLISTFGNHATYFLMSWGHINYFICPQGGTHKVFYVCIRHQKVGCVISKSQNQIFWGFLGSFFGKTRPEMQIGSFNSQASAHPHPSSPVHQSEPIHQLRMKLWGLIWLYILHKGDWIKFKMSHVVLELTANKRAKHYFN